MMPTVTSEGTTNPLDELERENEVTQRLIERLEEVSLALQGGTEVPPGEISEGLRLLGEYRMAHAHRFEADLLPEARKVAMASCFEHLDAITRDAGTLDGRLRGARAALEAYERREEGSRLRLASELETLSQHEYDGLRYEGDFPLSCLRATLPEEAAAQVGAQFGVSAAAFRDLEGHLDQFLTYKVGEAQRDLTVHCAQPGCDAVAAAQSYPTADGYLGIRSPPGWKATPRPVRLADGGKVVMDIDFLCPTHWASAGTSGAQVSGSAPPTGRLNPDRDLRAPTCGSPCCEPLPEASE